MASPLDVATAFGASAFLAASFGGVTMSHFVFGATCYAIGSGCRFALKIATTSDAGTAIPWQRATVTLGVSPFLGAFASMVVYMAASLGHFEGDAAIGILLALAALRGAEGIQWIVTLASKFLPAKVSGAQEVKP